MTADTEPGSITQAWSPWRADDVYAAYQGWRDQHGQVAWDDQAQSWFVVGYRAAREVLVGRDWSSDPMSSDVIRRMLEEQGIGDSAFGGSILTADPPDHSRLRDSVRDVFTPNYVSALAPGIEAIAADTIDSLPTGQPFDFMASIAKPFPIAVIAEWLALDLDTTRILWTEAAELVRLLDGVLQPGQSAPDMGALTALIAEFLPLAAARREDPGDDLLSLLAVDTTLDLEEVVVNAILLAIAGHETTANMLGNSMIRLLAEAEGGRLTDRIDLTAPEVVGELFRLEGPAHAVGRTALRSHDLEGCTVEAGQRVVVAIAAANRDPDIFDDPDSFRIDRTEAPGHLSLGFGRHRCLGAALARLETDTALRRVLDRDPILVGAPGTHRPSVILRGPQTVPMVFRAP